MLYHGQLVLKCGMHGPWSTWPSGFCYLCHRIIGGALKICVCQAWARGLQLEQGDLHPNMS